MESLDQRRTTSDLLYDAGDFDWTDSIENHRNPNSQRLASKGREITREVIVIFGAFQTACTMFPKFALFFDVKHFDGNEATINLVRKIQKKKNVIIKEIRPFQIRNMNITKYVLNTIVK